MFWQRDWQRKAIPGRFYKSATENQQFFKTTQLFTIRKRVKRK